VVYDAIPLAKALQIGRGSKGALAVVVPWRISNIKRFSLNIFKCSNIKQHFNEGQKHFVKL